VRIKCAFNASALGGTEDGARAGLVREGGEARTHKRREMRQRAKSERDTHTQGDDQLSVRVRDRAGQVSKQDDGIKGDGRTKTAWSTSVRGVSDIGNARGATRRARGADAGEAGCPLREPVQGDRARSACGRT
jgi:hypothetical protein